MPLMQIAFGIKTNSLTETRGAARVSHKKSTLHNQHSVQKTLTKLKEIQVCVSGKIWQQWQKALH